jgi:succinate dehydrogenase/fumarate reductase flavoprotein subunit
MSKIDGLGDVIEADVLVIGGGLSGLWAANRAREFVESVLIVDKGPPMGYAGEGYFSGGNLQAVPPGEDIDEYVKDIISLGDGLYEQDLIEKILKQSLERLEDFRGMGCEFEEEDGALKYVPQRGLKHNACYIGRPSGAGGRNMMLGLAKKAKRLGVRYLSWVYITDLIKKDDRVIGAVGFSIRGGQFHIFKAKAIILAAGGCSFRGGYEATHMCYGEGIELALNAGAELFNLEFVTMWIMPKKFRWEGVTFLLPLGAELVNQQGDPFMEKYSPVFKSNCDYNFIARAMAMEAREGRCPFYLDCSRMRPEDKKLMTPAEGWTKLQYKQLLEVGIKPFEKRQEWTATPWTNSFVHSDHEMRTKAPGLFVAGILRNTDPGIYFGGWSICKTAAFGHWAGESAGKYAKSVARPDQIEEGQVRELKRIIYAPLGKTGIDSEKVLVDLQRNIFTVLVLKNEVSLQRALHKVETIRDEILPKMGASDLHQLAKLRGIRSMTLVAELVLRASLMRTESRASHYREDCPERDDGAWLKWIMASQQNGKLNFRLEPVPLAEYKHKTWHCYSDNFEFPRQDLANRTP